MTGRGWLFCTRGRTASARLGSMHQPISEYVTPPDDLPLSLFRRLRVCTLQTDFLSPRVHRLRILWATVTLLPKTSCGLMCTVQTSQVYHMLAKQEPGLHLGSNPGSWKMISLLCNLSSSLNAEMEARELRKALVRLALSDKASYRALAAQADCTTHSWMAFQVVE